MTEVAFILAQRQFLMQRFEVTRPTAALLLFLVNISVRVLSAEELCACQRILLLYLVLIVSVPFFAGYYMQ